MFDDDGDDDDKKKTKFRKQRIRRPLRPVSRAADKKNKIKELNCFGEIDRRIRLGWATPDLVRAIHDEFHEAVDLRDDYLAILIHEYRRTIPAAEMSLANPNSLIGRRAIKKVSDGIDELEELEKLYLMQMDRIEIDYSNEQKINKLLPTTGREIFVAMKILRQSAELKMDLGLVKRQIGSVEVTGQVAAEVTERYGKDAIGKVIADPDSRRKVLGLAERLFQLGANASLDVVDMLGSASDSKEIIDASVAEAEISEPATGDDSASGSVNIKEQESND